MSISPPVPPDRCHTGDSSPRRSPEMTRSINYTQVTGIDIRTRYDRFCRDELLSFGLESG